MDLLSSESCLPRRAHCRSHSAAHHGRFKPPHPFWLHPIPWPPQFLRHNSCPKEPRMSAFPAVSSHLESTPATQLCVDAGPSPPPTPLLSSVPSWCRDIVRWWCLWSCLCQLRGHSKILQAGWLEQQVFIFSPFYILEIHGQDASKFCSCWKPSSWLTDRGFLLCPHMAIPCLCVQRKDLVPLPLLVRTLVLLH